MTFGTEEHLRQSSALSLDHHLLCPISPRLEGSNHRCYRTYETASQALFA
jgi:hypothetical protein